MTYISNIIIENQHVAYIELTFFSVSPKGGEDVYPITEIFDGKEIHYKATHIVAKIDHDQSKDGSNIGLVSLRVLVCY